MAYKILSMALLMVILFCSCHGAMLQPNEYDYFIETKGGTVGITRESIEQYDGYHYQFTCLINGRVYRHTVKIDSVEQFVFNSAWDVGSFTATLDGTTLRCVSGIWRLTLDVLSGQVELHRDYQGFEVAEVLGTNEADTLTVQLIVDNEIGLADVVVFDHADLSTDYLFSAYGGGISFLFDDHDQIIVYAREHCSLRKREDHWAPHTIGGIEYDERFFVDVMVHEGNYLVATCPKYDLLQEEPTEIVIEIFDPNQRLIRTINTGWYDRAKERKLFYWGWPTITVGNDGDVYLVAKERSEG